MHTCDWALLCIDVNFYWWPCLWLYYWENTSSQKRICTGSHHPVCLLRALPSLSEWLNPLCLHPALDPRPPFLCSRASAQHLHLSPASLHWLRSCLWTKVKSLQWHFTSWTRGSRMSCDLEVPYCPSPQQHHLLDCVLSTPSLTGSGGCLFTVPSAFKDHLSPIPSAYAQMPPSHWGQVQVCLLI